MTNFAIDVVLLPPEGIMDDVLAINQKLIKQFDPKIILDKKKCLPHISLLMGCISSSDLSSLEKALQAVTARFVPLALTIDSIDIEPIPTGEVSLFGIGKTPELQSVHESIVVELGPLTKQPATVESMYNSPEPEPLSLQWINGFLANSTFEKFSPHITIGFGKTDQKLKQPIEFTASTLAVCHLGNYCTCREILFSLDLPVK